MNVLGSGPPRFLPSIVTQGTCGDSGDQPPHTQHMPCDEDNNKKRTEKRKEKEKKKENQL